MLNHHPAFDPQLCLFDRHWPWQVRETQSTVRDGRTGQQSITISRGLKDKVRAAALPPTRPTPFQCSEGAGGGMCGNPANTALWGGCRLGT
jgi:hypothetical protein